MVFEFSQKVLFKHCDPAGLVFYPRYFEMINDCIETFFSDVIGWPFEEMHKTGGVPTVQINTKFSVPSRHGDQLLLKLTATELGERSFATNITAYANNEERFSADTVLVYVNEAGRPTSWPESHKIKIFSFMRSEND